MAYDYSGWGNEKLVPLAVKRDKDAAAELVRRGNRLEVDADGKPTGRLLTELKGSQVHNGAIKDTDTVTIADGAIVQVNGEDWPVAVDA